MEQRNLYKISLKMQQIHMFIFIHSLSFHFSWVVQKKMKEEKDKNSRWRVTINLSHRSSSVIFISGAVCQAGKASKHTTTPSTSKRWNQFILVNSHTQNEQMNYGWYSERIQEREKEKELKIPTNTHLMQSKTRAFIARRCQAQNHMADVHCIQRR